MFKKKFKFYALLISFLCFLAMLAYSMDQESPSSDEYAFSKAIKIYSEKGSCSGEQVKAPSGQSYILTAAHCRLLADKDNNFTIETEDGLTLKRKFIAEDENSDLMLLEGVPNMDGLDVADRLYKKQHARTFTHGHGFDTYKTEGVMIGEIDVRVPLFDVLITSDDQDIPCHMAKHQLVVVEFLGQKIGVCLLHVPETITNAFIVPGSSGGMVLDDEGKLIGVVSAGDGKFGFLVELRDIKEFLKGY